MASRLINLVVVVFISSVSFAQPCQDCPPDNPPQPDVPVSGLEILLGIGGLYGAKRVYDIRKGRA